MRNFFLRARSRVHRPTQPAQPTPVGSPVLWLDAGNPASYSGSGQTWTDLSESANHFTMYNTTYTSPYFSLNGSNSYGERGSIAAVENGTSDFTVSVWYQRDVIQGGLSELVSSWPGTNMFVSFFFGFSGATTVRVGDGFHAGISEVNTTNTWQNLTIVNSNTANNAFVYLNGGLKVTKGSRLNTTNSNNTFWIGRQGHAGEFFNGKIAVILIYPTALTQAEIAENISRFNVRGFGI